MNQLNYLPDANRRSTCRTGAGWQTGRTTHRQATAVGGGRSAKRSLMRVQYVFSVGVAVFVFWEACAADCPYYEVFKEALSNGQKGVLTSVSLVDSNNPGPMITNAISLDRFREGELIGVRLGMGMSEVVRAWGKPARLFSQCGYGPRLDYKPGRNFGDVSLFFVEERLLRIVVSGTTLEGVSFDNGLAGKHRRADFEKRLGGRAIASANWLDDNQISCRTNSVRTDFIFEGEPEADGSHRLRAVELLDEAAYAARKKREQVDAPNERR